MSNTTEEVVPKDDGKPQNSWLTSPVLVALASAVFGLLGAAVGAILQGYFNYQLEQQKFKSALINDALEPDDEQDRVNRLLFLLESGFLDKQLNKEGIMKLLADPASLPQYADDDPSPTCTGRTSLKAESRTLQIQIEPKEGSKPTLISMAMRIVDRATPPGPTKTREFSASQLKAGVKEKLGPAKRYEMLLVTIAPQGTQLVVNIDFDDGTRFVDGATCTRGANNLAGDWVVTTWKP